MGQQKPRTLRFLFAHRRKADAYMRSQAPRHTKAAGIKTQKSSRVLRPPTNRSSSDLTKTTTRESGADPSRQPSPGPRWRARDGDKGTCALTGPRRWKAPRVSLPGFRFATGLGGQPYRPARPRSSRFGQSILRRRATAPPSGSFFQSELGHRQATGGVRCTRSGGKSVDTSGRDDGGEGSGHHPSQRVPG